MPSSNKSDGEGNRSITLSSTLNISLFSYAVCAALGMVKLNSWLLITEENLFEKLKGNTWTNNKNSLL